MQNALHFHAVDQNLVYFVPSLFAFDDPNILRFHPRSFAFEMQNLLALAGGTPAVPPAFILASEVLSTDQADTETPLLAKLRHQRPNKHQCYYWTRISKHDRLVRPCLLIVIGLFCRGWIRSACFACSPTKMETHPFNASSSTTLYRTRVDDHIPMMLYHMYGVIRSIISLSPSTSII